jgi:hypothetical protein
MRVQWPIFVPPLTMGHCPMTRNTIPPYENAKEEVIIQREEVDGANNPKHESTLTNV